MTKRIVSVLLAVLCIGLQAFAQNAVSGKVTDASGEPNNTVSSGLLHIMVIDRISFAQYLSLFAQCVCGIF